VLTGLFYQLFMNIVSEAMAEPDAFLDVLMRVFDDILKACKL